MAGTVTITKNIIRNNNERIEEYLFDWVADAADGSVPNTQTTKAVTGWVAMGETDPGSTAPTADYDIAVNDENGVDIFGAELNNRSASATEQAIPKIGNAYGERFVNSKLTMALTNNSVNSATGRLRLIVRKGTI